MRCDKRFSTGKLLSSFSPSVSGCEARLELPSRELQLAVNRSCSCSSSGTHTSIYHAQSFHPVFARLLSLRSSRIPADENINLLCLADKHTAIRTPQMHSATFSFGFLIKACPLLQLRPHT